MDFVLSIALIGIGFFLSAPIIIVISRIIEEEKKRRYEDARLREIQGYPPKRKKR